jgi:hypothetical protein
MPQHWSFYVHPELNPPVLAVCKADKSFRRGLSFKKYTQLPWVASYVRSETDSLLHLSDTDIDKYVQGELILSAPALASRYDSMPKNHNLGFLPEIVGLFLINAMDDLQFGRPINEMNIKRVFDELLNPAKFKKSSALIAGYRQAHEKGLETYLPEILKHLKVFVESFYGPALWQFDTIIGSVNKPVRLTDLSLVDLRNCPADQIAPIW